MNQVITSKGKIMLACRQIVAEQGLEALNMRAVAARCGVSIGTLYNYYADKDELVLATVESIWRDIFHSDGPCHPAESFIGYVSELYGRLIRGAERYPNFLTGHSVGIAAARRGEAKSAMEQTFAHMKAGMLEALQSDPSIQENTFTPIFTPEMLAKFVLDNMLFALVQGQPDCGGLLEVLRRTLCMV